MIAVGFTVVADGHRVRFKPHANSDELATRHLSFSRSGDLTFLLMGRVYYRAEHLDWLSDRTDPARYEACRASDSALAAELYAEGGLDRLELLEGDFVLVGSDAAERRLVAIRSPSGAYPLFWLRSGETIALGTSLRTLIDYLPDPRPDEEYAADFLAFPISSLMELHARRTAYRGIERLLPGWSFEAKLSTGDVRSRRCWNWEERVKEVPVSTVEEAGELFRECLEKSVAERLSRTAGTACHFSGGMDSTGVALLAEKLLHERGQTLEALTQVYSRDPVLLQEREYLECALEGRYALRHHPLPADDFLLWDGHEEIPLIDEPAPGIIHHKMQTALSELGRQAGADTILTGDGADHLFAHPPQFMAAELLRKWEVRRALNLVRAHAAAGSKSTWEMLTHSINYALPPSLRGAFTGVFGAGRGSFRQMDFLLPPPWFTEDYVRRQRLQERTMRQLARNAEGHMFGVADMEFVVGDWFNWNIAAPLGMSIAQPYFDTRVMALGLGFPARLHERPRPMKPVLAAAMRGVLPDKILHRSRKAHFNSLITGFARHQEWLERLAQEAPLEDGVIDRGVLLDSLNKVALNVFKDALTLGRLEMTLAYLKWLADRDAWKAQTVRDLPLSSLAPRPEILLAERR